VKNKNPNQRFCLVKNGYDKREVDGYLQKLEESNKKLVLTYQDELLKYKRRNAELEEEVAHLKSREDEIKMSLLAANEKANEMNLDLKIQYALEIERLKLFQAKWTNCYEELKERYHFGKDALNMESVVEATALEIENLLTRDFSLPRENKSSDIEKQFKSEVKRLGMNEDELSSLFEKMKSELNAVIRQKTEKFSEQKELA
jgi:cell division septum initiation protein DivIVA